MIAAWLVAALAAGPEIREPGPSERITAYYTIKVAQRSDSMQAIIDETKRLGGWFASLTDDESVSLRVPAAKVAELQAFIEAQGLVAERSYATSDARREIAEIDARIRSRRELLSQYLGLMATANVDAVLQLEFEVTQLIAQVESLEGQLRQLNDQVAIARVDVGFRFRDRRRDQGAGPSAFGWINELDVHRVEGDLRSDRVTTARRPSVGRPTIDGFAVYREKKEFRAASPEGVVVRTRAVKHKPRADVAFWTEAVQSHLVAHGYRLVRDEEVSGARWLEWVVPVGEEDHTYVTVLRPAGGRIDVVEAAGIAETWEARRDAVRAGVAAALAAP